MLVLCYCFCSAGCNYTSEIIEVGILKEWTDKQKQNFFVYRSVAWKAGTFFFFAKLYSFSARSCLCFRSQASGENCIFILFQFPCQEKKSLPGIIRSSLCLSRDIKIWRLDEKLGPELCFLPFSLAPNRKQHANFERAFSTSRERVNALKWNHDYLAESQHKIVVRIQLKDSSTSLHISLALSSLFHFIAIFPLKH